jgi:Domain of unknown function (DUF4258)
LLRGTRRTRLPHVVWKGPPGLECAAPSYSSRRSSRGDRNRQGRADERRTDRLSRQTATGIISLAEPRRPIKSLVARKEVRFSEHGYDELAQDSIRVTDVLSGVVDGQVAEDYPDYPKGPCVLVLQRDRGGEPVHVVWGIPKRQEFPAVVVTAYGPDPQKGPQTSCTGGRPSGSHQEETGSRGRLRSGG